MIAKSFFPYSKESAAFRLISVNELKIKIGKPQQIGRMGWGWGWDGDLQGR
jgi:hypothetical protein